MTLASFGNLSSAGFSAVFGLKPRDFIYDVICSGISANTLELDKEEGIIRMKYIESFSILNISFKLENKEQENSKINVLSHAPPSLNRLEI